MAKVLSMGLVVPKCFQELDWEVVAGSPVRSRSLTRLLCQPYDILRHRLR